MEARIVELDRKFWWCGHLFALLLVGIVAVGGVVGCSLHPIYRVQSTLYITAHENHTLKQVKTIIYQVGLRQNWKMDYVDEGHFVATRTSLYKSRVAVVDIVFDTETFSITYKDSKRIKVKCKEIAEGDVCTPTEIHKLYNLWVQNLEWDILGSLSKL